MKGMFYNNLYIDPYAGNRLNTSYVRVLHASPNAPAVDIYVNNILAVSNLYYRNFSQYYPIAAGQYNIKVYPAGQITNPIINTNLMAPDRVIGTIAITGMLNEISLLTVPDTPMAIPSGTVSLRFVHLSPNTPAVDVSTTTGVNLFSNIAYKQIPNYISVNPGTYAIHIRPAGSLQPILYVPNITLLANRFYTIYLVGIRDGNPPLQVLIPLDGNSYIKV